MRVSVLRGCESFDELSPPELNTLANFVELRVFRASEWVLDDRCALTTYSGAKRISEQYGFPLITVVGGSGFQGGACQAQTEHGFKGMEPQTMRSIANILKSAKSEKAGEFHCFATINLQGSAGFFHPFSF